MNSPSWTRSKALQTLSPMKGTGLLNIRMRLHGISLSRWNCLPLCRITVPTTPWAKNRSSGLAWTFAMRWRSARKKRSSTAISSRTTSLSIAAATSSSEILALPVLWKKRCPVCPKRVRTIIWLPRSTSVGRMDER